MVGPRGVGKTSLLAAMYNELDSELSRIGCTLSLEAGPTLASINGQLKDLKKLATGTGIKVQAGEGIAGGSDMREYIFNLDVGNGGEPETALRFVDIPGGWYSGTGDWKIADQEAINSRVSFLAVDATALMESPSKDLEYIGKYHEDINSPSDIHEFYKRAKFAEGHIVILSLIRAETYVKQGNIDLLLKKTKYAYRELSDRLNKNGIPFYACYVETVGSLIFNSFTESDGIVSSHFRRDPKIGYRPSRCAIPLRIAAGTALGKALDQSALKVMQEDGVINNVLDFFGMENALKKAREKHATIYKAFEMIASNIKDDDFIELTP
jgi:hypothetical protein